jgi:hypothetical protein
MGGSIPATAFGAPVFFAVDIHPAEGVRATTTTVLGDVVEERVYTLAEATAIGAGADAYRALWTPTTAPADKEPQP